MSEVAHRSFCVKFSGLIIELIILENYIEVLEYSKHKFIFGLFLKLRKSTFQEKKKKDLWCADEAFRIILLQIQNTFCGNIIFFLAAGNKKIPAGKCDSYTRKMDIMQMNPPDDWFTTGFARDSQTLTRIVDSLLCITCSLGNNAFSVLHYFIKVTLHHLMLHRFEIHSALGLSRKALSVRLPPRSLREAARWQLFLSSYYFFL